MISTLCEGRCCCCCRGSIFPLDSLFVSPWRPLRFTFRRLPPLHLQNSSSPVSFFYLFVSSMSSITPSKKTLVFFAFCVFVSKHNLRIKHTTRVCISLKTHRNGDTCKLAIRGPWGHRNPSISRSKAHLFKLRGGKGPDTAFFSRPVNLHLCECGVGAMERGGTTNISLSLFLFLLYGGGYFFFCISVVVDI